MFVWTTLEEQYKQQLVEKGKAIKAFAVAVERVNKAFKERDLSRAIKQKRKAEDRVKRATANLKRLHEDLVRAGKAYPTNDR